jgi:hypothetical protein
MTVRLPLVLTAIVLALGAGACGGDDGGSGTGTSTAEEPGTFTTNDGTTTTERQDQQSQPQDSEGPLALELDKDRQPAAPKNSVPPEERTDAPPRYTRKNPIPKEQLKAIERPVYEQSRYLCRRLGIAGMRREYRLSSRDPEAIARAVAERTYLREARDAVFSGCLAGLRSGD